MSEEKPKKEGAELVVVAKDGRVLIGIPDKDTTLVLTITQAMELANSIIYQARQIDARTVNEQLKQGEQLLQTFARMLFGAAGMHLTTKSPVGLADHNESVGLAVRLLCQEADMALQHELARRSNGGGNQDGPR